ncbi:MAG: Uma2 family endonuclease [Pirellulales bacterium]
MATVSKPYYTEAEYVARERRATYKSEYYRGEIFAMAGATREHNLVAVNVASRLVEQLRKTRCEVYPSDMRVRLPTGLYTYPDVSVACGEPRFLDDEVDTLLNPNVIVEVLSASTEAYDRGEKAQQYRSLESLAHYVLIASEKLHIEVHTRQANRQWLISEASDLAATIELPAINCRLSLAEVYDKVTLTQQHTGRGIDEAAAKDQAR